jgi:murein DD-endopeptidase MepM/ murein hydrolase activator NlpD
MCLLARMRPRLRLGFCLAIAIWLPVAVPCVVGLGATASATAPERSRAQYAWPVSGAIHVVRGFDRSASTYGAGHRGVDLSAAPDRVVLAAAAGTVAYAGAVAGRGVIVIDHLDGIRTTYEPITPSVARGQLVVLGQPIGVVSGVHGDFAPDTVLHWGARRGDVYLDPASLRRPLGPVRLVPN